MALGGSIAVEAADSMDKARLTRRRGGLKVTVVIGTGESKKVHLIP
jgi:hypothetical protein